MRGKIDLAENKNSLLYRAARDARNSGDEKP